jgi:hypothetical protein
LDDHHRIHRGRDRELITPGKNDPSRLHPDPSLGLPVRSSRQLGEALG